MLRERKPWFAVECKTGDRSSSAVVRYFKERTTIPQWFQVNQGDKDVVVDWVRVLPFAKFCTEVSLPRPGGK